MKKYDSYKDSGVEWVGEIPSNWEKKRLRFTGKLFGGLTGKSGDDFNQDDNPNNKPYIPYTNIFNNTYISQNHFHYVVLGEDEKQNRVKKFDLFFLMSSETHQDLGKPCILIEEVEELYLNSFCKGFRINKDYLNPLFLNYQLLGQIHKELISIEGRGFTRINLRQDRLNDTPLFIPPLPEQKQIVSFLDTKTTLVDTLIEKTQRKIKLLKEQRTSLINHTVTKGLNPHVEMKDSGVEWIGGIPEHWEVKRVKYLLITDVGIKIGPFGSSLKLDSLSDSGIKIYGQGNVIKDDFELGSRYLPIDRFENDFQQYEILDGDVLVTMMGTTGKSKVFDNKYQRGILDSHLLRLRFDSEKFISYLFTLILQESDYLYHQIKLKSNGSIMEGLNSSIIKELSIMTPPLYEQEKIVDYLDKKTTLIDTTISTEQKRIELLKEYRQSLISNVVTGKIKVTNDE